MCLSFIHLSVSIGQVLWAEGMLNPGDVGVRDVCCLPGTYHLVEDLTRKAGGGRITECPKYYIESGLHPGEEVNPKPHPCRTQEGTLFPMALPLGWPL